MSKLITHRDSLSGIGLRDFFTYCGCSPTLTTPFGKTHKQRQQPLAHNVEYCIFNTFGDTSGKNMGNRLVI